MKASLKLQDIADVNIQSPVFGHGLAFQGHNHTLNVSGEPLLSHGGFYIDQNGNVPHLARQNLMSARVLHYPIGKA